MPSNPSLYQSLLVPIDGTAALPKIQIGGSSVASSGTGIYGDATNIKFSVAGNLVNTISASGISGAGSADSILVFTSAAGAGGAATEVMVVTGLLSTDTILSVCQKTPGANDEPLIGYSTQANNALTAIYSADPDAGSVIVVAVKR